MADLSKKLVKKRLIVPEAESGYEIPEPPTPDEADAIIEHSHPNPDAHHAVTAFLVIIEKDGTARAMSDVNYDLVLERGPTPDDMWRGAAEVAKDVQMAQTAQIAAQMTMQLQMQTAAKVQQQIQSQKMLENLNERGLKLR